MKIVRVISLLASLAFLNGNWVAPALAGGKGLRMGGAKFVAVHPGKGKFHRRVFGLSRGRGRCSNLHSYYVRRYGIAACRRGLRRKGTRPVPIYLLKSPGQDRPWSWRNFREHAGWEQRSHLWQSRIYARPW